jgi:predicted dehydrogenase
MEYRGGALLDLGCYCLAYQRYLSGEEPSVVKAAALLNDDGVDINLCAWPGEAFRIRLWSGNDYREIEIPAANPYQLLVEEFHAALRDGKPMDISLDETLNNMRAVDAVRASTHEGNRQ